VSPRLEPAGSSSFGGRRPRRSRRHFAPDSLVSSSARDRKTSRKTPQITKTLNRGHCPGSYPKGERDTPAMMLIIFRKHLKTCPHRSEGRAHRRCRSAVCGRDGRRQRVPALPEHGGLGNRRKESTRPRGQQPRMVARAPRLRAGGRAHPR
jgi:hypothetical protein